MARIAGGDAAAFETVYRDRLGMVRKVIWQQVSNLHDVEEIVQNVFLLLWRAAARFDPARGSLGTWISTMAYQASIDFHRRGGKHRKAIDGLKRHGRERMAAPPDGEDPIEQARGCLDQLGDADRLAVVLRFGHDMAGEQIAAIENIPHGTLKSRWHRISRKLQESPC